MSGDDRERDEDDDEDDTQNKATMSNSQRQPTSWTMSGLITVSGTPSSAEAAQDEKLRKREEKVAQRQHKVGCSRIIHFLAEQSTVKKV